MTLYDYRRATTDGYTEPIGTGGQSSIKRRAAVVTNASIGSSGDIYMTFWRAWRSEHLTQMLSIIGTVPAGATPTLTQFGIWLVGSTTAALVANTANATSAFITGGAGAAMSAQAFVAPLDVVEDALYCSGWLVVTGAAMPNTIGVNYGGDLGGFRPEMARADRIGGNLTGQASLPASFNLSSLANRAINHYHMLLP